MQKTLLKKSLVVLSIMFFLPSLLPASFAWAKRRPPRAYSFIAEGGKASQAECDGERKIPRLKKLKEFSKTRSYMGSELQTPEINAKPDQEMWKHLFRDKGSCNAVLAKTPSALDDKKAQEAKPELPPEESVESDDESPQAEGSDSDSPAEAETDSASDTDAD